MWALECNRLARDRYLGLDYGPRATVGWWLVPVANLVVPLRMVSELWKASVRPEPVAWRKVRVPLVVPAWWVLFLTMIGARVVLFARVLELGVITDPGDDPFQTFETLRAMFRGDLVQQGIAIFATALTFVIVHQISKGLRNDPTAEFRPG